jgi:hypothetical protein
LRCCDGARENGCPWDWQTCAYAAACGHIELLRWARGERRAVDRDHAPKSGFEGIRRSLSRRRDRRERESHNARRTRRDETNDVIDT